MGQERDELVATLEVLKRKLEKGSISREDYEWMSGQVRKRLDALGPAPPGAGGQPTPLQVREDVAELRRIARDQDERIETLGRTVKELSALDSRVREFASMLTGFQELVGLRKELEHRMALQEVKVKELLEKTIELEKYDVQALFRLMEKLKGIPEEFATKIEAQEVRLRDLLQRAASFTDVDVKALVEGLDEMRSFAQNLVQRVELQERTLRELYESRTEALKKSDLEGLLQSLEGLREQPKILEQKLAAQEAALREIQEKAKVLDTAGQPQKIAAMKKTLDEVKRLGIDKLGSRLEAVDKYDESLREIFRKLESLAKEQEVRLGALQKRVEEVPELRAAIKKYTAWTAALIEEARLAPGKLEERMGAVEAALTDFQAQVREIPGAPDLRELKDLAARVKPGVERLQTRMEEVAREMERFRVLVDSGSLPDPAEIRALREKAAEVRGQMREVEESMRKQREEVQRRLGEAQTAVPDLAERAAEVAEITRRLMSLPPGLLERIESVGKEVEALAGAAEQKKGVEALRESVADLERRFREVSKHLEEVPAPEVVRTLQQGLSDLQGSLFSLERKIEEERLQWVSRFESLQVPADLAGTLARASAVAKDIGDLPARVKDLEARSATVVRREDLESLDTLVTELQELPKKNEQRLAAVTRRLDALERTSAAFRPEEVASLKAAVEEVRGLPRELESKVEALGQRLGALESKREGLATREEVEEVRALVGELHGLPRQLEGRLEAVGQKVAALESAAASVPRRKELDAVKALAEELKGFPPRLEGQLESLRQKLAGLEAAAGGAARREEVEGLRSALEEARGLPRENKQRIAELSERLQALGALAEEVRGRGESLGTRVRELEGLPQRIEEGARQLGARIAAVEAAGVREAREAEERMDGLSRQVGALEARTETRAGREQVDSLAARVEEVGDLGRRAEERLSALASEIQEVRAAVGRAATREEAKAAQGRAGELGRRLDGLASELRQGAEGLRRELKGLEKRAAALGTGLEGVRKELGEFPAAELLKRTVDEMEGLKEFPAFAEARLSGIASALDSLGSREGAAEKRLEDLRKSLEGLRPRLDAAGSRAEEALKGLRELRKFPAEARQSMDGLRSELEARAREISELRGRAEALEGAAATFASAERVGALEEEVGRMAALGAAAEERLRRSLETTREVAGLSRLAAESAERIRSDVAGWRSEMAEARERMADEMADSLSRVDGALRAAEERRAREAGRLEAEWRENAARLVQQAEAWRSESDARLRSVEGRLGAASDALRALEERQSQETGRIEAEWKGAVASLDHRFESWRSEVAEAGRRREDEHGQALSKLAGTVEEHGKSLEEARASQATLVAAENELRGALEHLREARESDQARQREEAEGLRRETRQVQEALADRFQKSVEEVRAALQEEGALRSRLEERLLRAEESVTALSALKEASDLTAAQLRQRSDTLAGELREVRAALDAARQSGERVAADLARVASEAHQTARGLEEFRTGAARADMEAAERAAALERRAAALEQALEGLRQRSEEAATRKELQGWGASVMESQKGLQAHLDDQLAQVRRAQKELADGARALESRMKEAPGEFQRAASALQRPLERRLEALEGAHRALRDLGESRFAVVEKRLRDVADLPAALEQVRGRQEQALEGLHQRVGALREAHQASEQRTASLQEAVEALRREQAEAARASEAGQARAEEARLALERRLDQFAQQQELALQGLRNLVRASSADVLEGRVKAIESGQEEVLHHAVTRLRTFEREVSDLRDLVEALFRSRDPASLEAQERRIEGALQELKSQAPPSGDERAAVEARLSRLDSLREGLRGWRAHQGDAEEARRRVDAQERETAAMGAMVRTLADRLKMAEEGFHSMRGSVESTLRGLAETDAKVIEDLAEVKGLLGRLVELEASLRRLQAMVETRPASDMAQGLRI